MGRVDDHPGQPRRVEQPLLLVEIPGAGLLRHQPALQPVGELGDRALQMDELLVEIGAQPPELLLVAQLRGLDLLVILGGEDRDSRSSAAGRRAAGSGGPGASPPRLPRPCRRCPRRAPPRTSRSRPAPRRLPAARRGSPPRRGRLSVLLVLVVVVAAFGLVAALAFLARSGSSIGLGLALDQLEVAEQLAGEVRRRRPGRRARGRARRDRRRLSPRSSRGRGRARRARALAAAPRRSAARGPSARSPSPSGTSVAAARPGQRIGPHPHLGEPGEIGAHARHRPRAQRLDPRLLGRVEHGAGDLVGRARRAVQRGIVMAQLQRRRVGEAPRLGRLVARRASGPASAP